MDESRPPVPGWRENTKVGKTQRWGKHKGGENTKVSGTEHDIRFLTPFSTCYRRFP